MADALQSELYDPELWIEVEGLIAEAELTARLATSEAVIIEPIEEEVDLLIGPKLPDISPDSEIKKSRLNIGPPMEVTYPEFLEMPSPRFRSVVPIFQEYRQEKTFEFGSSADEQVDMGYFEVLTKQQEIELMQIIEKGRAALYLLQNGTESADLEKAYNEGIRAKEHFMKSNLRLVGSVASRYPLRFSLTRSDYVQDGNLGMDHAIDKFDWRKGFKFSTYATFWIRQAITRGIDLRENLIRIPGHRLQEVRKQMRSPDFDPNELNSGDREIYDLITPTSLNIAANDDGDLEYGDLVAIAADNPEEEFIASLTVAETEDLLDSIKFASPEDLDIIKLRFWIGEPEDDIEYEKDGSFKPRSYEKMAKNSNYKVSHEHMRKKYTAAIESIRAELAVRQHVERCNLSEEEEEGLLIAIIMSKAVIRMSVRENVNEALSILEVVYGWKKIVQTIARVAENESEKHWLLQFFFRYGDRLASGRMAKNDYDITLSRAKELNTKAVLDLSTR